MPTTLQKRYDRLGKEERQKLWKWLESERLEKPYANGRKIISYLNGLTLTQLRAGQRRPELFDLLANFYGCTVEQLFEDPTL